MRTTVTIDADTEILLREEAKRSGLSFKQVLNEAIRRSLARQAEPIKFPLPFKAPFPASLGNESFNRLGEQWDDEQTLAENA